MGFPYNDDYDYYDYPPMQRRTQDQDILKAGWRPLHRELDWNFLWQLVTNDPWELSHRTMDLFSDVADKLGRRDYAWWSNLIGVFSGSIRYEVDEFLDYITPEPPGPDAQYTHILTTETPLVPMINRNSIPIDYVLTRLLELTVLKCLELLGRPGIILLKYEERHFYYPIDRFINWERLELFGTLTAYWPNHDVWLQVTNAGLNRRRYTLMAKELASLVNKATYGVAVMLSGYQNRVGKIHSTYTIRSFPSDVQNFTDAVQQAVLNQPQLAVLIHGKPGTGKTAWTQAVAKEILVPLGYVVFILDHDAVENFVPPTYLENICLIINEADNLARDRSSEIAQHSNRTEHILSLLDGTLYQSVIDDAGIQIRQRMVVLMTCNTTERLDPAMLRKGRVDLMCEFTHSFID